MQHNIVTDFRKSEPYHKAGMVTNCFIKAPELYFTWNKRDPNFIRSPHNHRTWRSRTAGHLQLYELSKFICNILIQGKLYGANSQKIIIPYIRYNLHCMHLVGVGVITPVELLDASSPTAKVPMITKIATLIEFFIFVDAYTEFNQYFPDFK